MHHLMAILVLVLFLPEIALACRCSGLNEEQQFDLAKAVFLARVVSIHAPVKDGEAKYDDPSLNGERGPNLFPPAQIRIRFVVQETLKGNPGEVPFIQTGYGSGDCGVPVRVGYSYVFFPDRWGNISICAGEGIFYHPLNQDSIAFLNRMRILAKSKHLEGTDDSRK